MYVVYEKPVYGYGMIFDQKGAFLYAVEPSAVKDIKKNGSKTCLIIDPKENSSPEIDIDEDAVLLISSFFNQLYRKNSLVMDSKPFFEEVFAKMLSGYDFNSKKILDYGSGHDTYSEFFPNSEYAGYDLNKKEIQFDEFQNEDFDVVLCNFVLEHVASIEKTMKQISEKLKPQGLLFISIPSLSFFEFIIFYVLKLKMGIPISHFRNFGFTSFAGCVSFNFLAKTMDRYRIRQKKITGIYRFRNKNYAVRIKPFCYFGNQTFIVGEKI